MKTIAGAVLGAVVGFLMRPSVPFLGQLPFATVITRGSNLSGLDILLRSTAERSFNYLLIGAIVGATAGFAVSKITSSRTAITPV